MSTRLRTEPGNRGNVGGLAVQQAEAKLEIAGQETGADTAAVAALILQLAVLAIVFQTVVATTPSNGNQLRPVSTSFEQPV